MHSCVELANKDYARVRKSSVKSLSACSQVKTLGDGR